MRKLRRRYVVFKVNGELNADAVWRSVEKAVRGVTPMPRLIFFDEFMKCGLLRCGHLQVGKIKEALGRLSVGGATFTIIGVSGTIKACKRKFLLKATRPDRAAEKR